ncbi:MAG: hypothetical protein ACLU0O_12040 [Collinsella sp.]
MMDINEKDERRELLDAVADAGRLARGLTSCSSPGARRPADLLDVEGPGPEVDKREVRRAHRRRRANPGGAKRDPLCRGTDRLASFRGRLTICFAGNT